MTDEVVARAVASINEVLNSSSRKFSKKEQSRLIDTRHCLNRLLEPNISRNDWTISFCRQLNRMLDNNDSLTEHFWEELHYDILYILEEAKNEQNKDHDWHRIVQKVELERKQRLHDAILKSVSGDTSSRFLRRMEFERELQQRELYFNQIVKDPKSLRQLFSEYGHFLEEYLHKCISFHSTIEVKGLTDDLLCRNYGLEKRTRLTEKLQCINITTDCSNRLLKTLDFQYSPEGHFSNRDIQDPSDFIPSTMQIHPNRNTSSKKLSHILQYDRWIVILGDPGSAKTTLLRWITRVFAETALSTYKNRFIRIPILIRIGEFATWLDQHETKTLIDYIGEHTWFTQRYCHDEKNILQELISYGHALVLLDGLDEIPDVPRRSEIIDLVRTFIDEHLRAPDFISAFDNQIFDHLWFDQIMETRPLNKFGGNQIVITSRLLGYDFCPLNGPFIKHYALELLNHDEAMKFVKEWILQVEKSVLDSLLSEGIQIDEGLVGMLSKKRNNVAEAIFENSSQLLLSNPALLVLICTFIFQLSDNFQPKSRIEVYYHIVQTTFHLWRKQEPTISESLINSTLSNLADYLHLKSPSGLIDAFDMEHLCRLSLKQENVSNDQRTVRQTVNKLIRLLESDNGIAVEKGLQVFSFSHLSFQEYFVAQSLVRGSSIKNITNRILSLVMNTRFRESLRLALGWISWKWSVDDYENFCNSLLNSTENYQIPFGTLLFFDAYNDLQRLPSNTIIFTALNSLFDHPSNVITERYIVPNLAKLDESIIQKWMELRLKDETCLKKFCQILPRKHYPFIYQQLWSLHSTSLSCEFIIDRTLRKIMISSDIPDQIFNRDFSSFILAHNICLLNIHPLILTIIFTVCGGLYLAKKKDIIQMEFSLKRMHRESSILVPIMEYLDNTKEPHEIKIQTLTKNYQNSLQHILSSDTSVDTVDIFIAVICLQGISEAHIYQKYNGYKALPLALERFKYTWFYFKEFCARSHFHPGMSLIRSEIESILNEFFSQCSQSDEQRVSFSVACAAASKKLGLWNSSILIEDGILRTELAKSFHSQSECIHLITEEKLNTLAKTLHSTNIFQCKPIMLLNFVPQSLQSLYWNIRDSLPFIVFLTQCLAHSEDIDKDDLNAYLTLPMLLPILKEHKLEHYALVIFQEEYYHGRFGDTDRQEFLKAMQAHKLLDSFPKKKSTDWKIEINIEHQRIAELKHDISSQDKDVKLFAASICLTRLFQEQYRSCKDEAKSDEIRFAVANISDPLLRTIALSIIFDIDYYSLIFSKERKSALQCEMISILQSSLADLSLLKSTLLFIRCYSARKHFPGSFQCMAHIIGKKLNVASVDEKQAAYIALMQLNNPDLAPYLFEFAKQTKILASLLQLNSTTFFRYFIDRTSFVSSNSILLSSMYLVELAFDVQILNMFAVNDSHKHDDISIRQELKDETMMTFKIASWITTVLEISNQEEIVSIIADTLHCLEIEQNALSIVEKWLNYRMDKNLRFFAHYAALQLIIHGSDNSDLIDIIKEILVIDNKFHFESFVNHLVTSPCINESILRQILIILQKNFHYSSKISVWIVRKEILELFLDLEHNRITSDLSSRPFLLMINGCSKDLQIYLRNKLIEIKDPREEKYIATVIKWMLQHLNWHDNKQYVRTLLTEQRFPLIQKVIINDLNFVFQDEDLLIHLDEIICSWKTYRDDVIAVCLLKYGNCLLKFKSDETDLDISNEVIDNLNSLFQTSSSEIVSIRAALCLILVQESNLELSTISSWIDENLDATFEKRYKFLVQLSLYDVDDDLFSIVDGYNGFSQLLETNLSISVERLLSDFYADLCNNDNNNYISDPTPDYISIALDVFESQPDQFCDIVRKCQFGEEEFKSELIPYCKKNPKFSGQLMELYIAFGTVTTELVDILKWFGGYHKLNHIKQLKQIPDHGVIENVFDLMDLTTSKIEFENLFDILEALFQADAISLREIHQRVPLINHILYDDFNRDEWRHTKDIICERLLDLSYFKNEDRVCAKRSNFTPCNIDEKFEKERHDLDKNCALFSTRNNLIIQLASLK